MYPEAGLCSRASQLSGDAAQLRLLLGRQSGKQFFNHARVLRKHTHDQPSSFRSQVDLNFAAVPRVSHAPHELVPLEVVDHRGDVAAAAQKFFSQRVLAHRAEVIERLHHRELAVRQPALIDQPAGFVGDRVGGAHDIDKRAEGPDLAFGSFVVGRHIRLSSNHSNSNDWTQEQHKRFRAGKWLIFYGFWVGRINTSLMKLSRDCVTIISTACATSSDCSSLLPSLPVCGENSVFTLPGQMALARIPNSRKSSAMQPVSPIN